MSHSTFGPRCTGEADVTLCMKLLCRTFHVRMPVIRFTRLGINSGRFFPHPRTGIVRLSPDCEQWVLLHEFSHHLHDQEYRKRDSFNSCGLNSYRYRGDDLPHGNNFRSCLLSVINEWLGDESLYPWDLEYPALKKWWHRERANDNA